MPTFTAPDGTSLAYRVEGRGRPLVCLPGGPMQDGRYLGDLGGLSQTARLIVLDPRGTGASARPADPGSYRCDRQVDDVEALRDHLGLERVDVLAHSAGTNLAVLHATGHPERVGRLVLVTPSMFALGIEVGAQVRRDVVDRRRDDPLHGQVSRALAAIAAGRGTDDDWEAIVPFTYGRWDAAARAAHALGAEQRDDEAATVYGSPGAFDPPATRAALADSPVPALVVAGELDLAAPPPAVAEYAALLPGSELVTIPGAGHTPWTDDPDGFAGAVTRFLAASS